jgi:structural maintenance of chromosomes protein 5
MPPVTHRRRSRTHYEADDDESSTSGSAKRQRVQDNGSTQGSQTDNESETSADGQSQDHQTNGHTTLNRLGRTRESHDGSYDGGDSGGFQPGAIVRVLVKNFVTYERAEFLPGPNLNMVIGPNGTGKSSLVCAICLGLGYHPKHLGRASNVGEFVKHGKDTAEIEVELQKHPNERANHVVRVRISREDNGRKWWLNDKESTHKAVQSLTKHLRIQIDNLCQFLPQDKVAEFAGLTPIQLLHETLRAAAPEKMLEWQTRLQDLHKEHKKLKELAETTAETLRGHESRQQGVQADVDRIHQREGLQKEIEELQNGRVIVEYNTVRRTFNEAKQKRKEAEKRLKELETACGPALEAVHKKTGYRDRIEPVVTHRKKALKDLETEADQLMRKIEAQDESIKNQTDIREAEAKSFQSKKGEIARSRKVITDLEAKLKNKPPDFVAAEWNLKIREQEAIIRDIAAERRETSARLDELKDIGKAKTTVLRDIRRQLEDLDSQQGQKLAHLKKINGDAATAWEWLQDENNQAQFEKEVFGPPMLTCSVKNERYSDLIQSLLQLDDMLCFTTQTRNDHKKLSDQFYKHMGLSVTIRTCGSDFSTFRPPVPREQLETLGLDGYAVDYLDGPDPILAMLSAEKRLHAAGVSLEDINDRQFEQLMKGERISSWSAGRTMYRISRRREYGAGAVSTTTRKVLPGRFWSDQPVDDGEKVRLQEQFREVKAETTELKEQHDELKQRLSDLDGREEEAREQAVGPRSYASFNRHNVNQYQDNLKRQKNELQKAVTVYEGLGEKIGTFLQSLRVDLY